MRIRGSKNKVQLPTSYDTGNGAVNFWLAILARSKADTGWHYAKIMWQDFKDSALYQGTHKDPVQIAWWVVQYVNERWCV